MENNEKLSRQQLIDKINLQVKVGYISLVMYVILYIGNIILSVTSSKFKMMEDFLILLLLATILGYILDGYKLIRDVLKATNDKKDDI